MTKEELQKIAEALYPIHEDDLSLIRNIREYEQNAYIKGYLDAKKKFGWHPYPEEKPSEDGEYFVTIDAQDTWHQSSWWTEKGKAFVVWDNHITEWMPIQKEGGNDE